MDDENIEILKKHIRGILCFPEKELEEFCSYFNLKKFNKNEFLLKQGDMCNFEGFIVKGCCSLFYLDDRLKSHTLYFAVEEMWVMDLDSFLNRVPSQFSIQALEDCELLIINKKNKEKAYDTIPAVNTLFRILSQQTLINFKETIMNNFSKNSDERYIDFMKTSPAAHRLTNTQIATHLGVSREFISKIRRKITTK